MNKAETVDQLLSEHRVIENQASMAAYMKHHFEFYGIKSQLRRSLTKPILTEMKNVTKTTQKIQWDFIKELWNFSARENQYVAADYLNEVDKYITLDDLNEFQELIINKSWWDSVDILVKRVGNLSLRNSETKKIILNWAKSENIWLKRTSIICQLGLKESTDTDLLKTVIIENLKTGEFFVDKAIGWALREYAKTNVTWVKAFIEKYQKDLAPLSIREAQKHMK